MLAGLTPVGITFVVILLTAMSIGVTATIYYSWLAPLLARRRLRKRADAEKAIVESSSPTIQHSPYTDSNAALLTPYLGQDSSIEKSATMFAKDDSDFILSPPAPAYACGQKGRFSTSTNDGIWWVV